MPLNRLIAAAVLLVGLFAGLAAGVVAWRVEDAARPDVAAKLEGVGRTVAGQIGLALDYGIPFDAIPGMVEFLAAMTADLPEINRVRVEDADGAALYTLGPDADGSAVRVPVVARGVTEGAVVLGLAPQADSAGTSALLARLSAVVAAAAVIGGGLAGLGAWWWVGRPLRRLHQSLEGLAAGDLSVEPPDDAPGEIGALARATERLRAGAERRAGDFAVEMEEIALAQPDAERRAVIESLAAEAR